MADILDGWEFPLDDDAQILLKHAAGDINGSSTLGVFLAALTHPEMIVHQVLKKVIGKSSPGLIDFLQSGRHKSTTEDEDLATYILACSEIAKEEQIKNISGSLILWQIIEKSSAVFRVCQLHGIDLHELQKRCQEEAGVGQSPLAGPYSLTSTRKIPALAVPEVWRNISIVSLPEHVAIIAELQNRARTTGYLAEDRSLVRDFKDIWPLQPDRILTIAGPNGSTIDILKYLLAYQIQQNEQRLLGESAALAPLWEISLNNFRDLACRRRLPLDTLFEYLKLMSVERQAILLLTDFEDIQPDTAVGKKIKKQLEQPEGARIICCYKYETDLLSGSNWLFASLSARTIFVQKMEEKRQIYDFIHAYHRPVWQERGYWIDDSTFDGLFQFEEGIQVLHKRKTWPYLGIDLVDECIQTAQRGNQSIRRLTEGAQQRLNKIVKKEAQQTDAKTRSRFATPLNEAKQRIEELHKHPELPQKDGFTIISQAMIEAQLFCSPTSEFHYPGGV